MASTTLQPVEIEGRRIIFERNLPAWKEGAQGQLELSSSKPIKTVERMLTQVPNASAFAKEIKLLIEVAVKCLRDAATLSPFSEGLGELTHKFSVVIGATAFTRLPKVWSDAVACLTTPRADFRPDGLVSSFAQAVRHPMDIIGKVSDAVATTAACVHWVGEDFPQARGMLGHSVQLIRGFGLVNAAVGLATAGQDLYQSYRLWQSGESHGLENEYKEKFSLDVRFYFLKTVSKVCSFAVIFVGGVLTSLGFVPATIALAGLSLSLLGNTAAVWASYMETASAYKAVKHFG